MKKELLFLIILALIIPSTIAASLEQRQEYRACSLDCRDLRTNDRDECRAEYSQCREQCEDRDCSITCARERISCMRQVTAEYRECRGECRELLIPKCEFSGEVYQAGDKFENGCEICECRRNRKVKCKQEAFCNKDAEVNQEQCESSGGLFQALCRGGNFHLYCNRQDYCICGGNDNFSCPEEYECLYDFKPPRTRTNTVPVWVDMRGSPLGNIGICVQ